jgi:glycosyltransferase involved in cell wall biosynthesis
MAKPILSVLIDTYNHQQYIEHAIISAIEQDFPAVDYEILVVDDGSTDRTPEIARKFAPRVRLLSKKNRGQASAYNAGIREARGDVIAFLDGDDWFVSGKLTIAMNTLKEHPEAAAVGHGYYEFSEADRQTRKIVAPHAQLLRLTTPQSAHEALLATPFLHNAALTVHRGMVERIAPIPEVLAICADAPLAVGSMAMGLFLLDQPLHYYRLHAANLYATDPDSARKGRHKHETEQIMFEQLELLLARLDVHPDSIRTFLYPPWIELNRARLRAFGGRRATALWTEMRSFHLEHKNPSMGYRLFKYLVVGTSTLLLPPRVFYRSRDWYGRRNLGRVRERVAGTK